MRKPINNNLLKDILAGKVAAKSLTSPNVYGIHLWELAAPGVYKNFKSGEVKTQVQFDEEGKQLHSKGINILMPEGFDIQAAYDRA